MIGDVLVAPEVVPILEGFCRIADWTCWQAPSESMYSIRPDRFILRSAQGGDERIDLWLTHHISHLMILPQNERVVNDGSERKNPSGCR